MPVQPPTTPEERLLVLEEIVSRVFGPSTLIAEQLAGLLEQLRQFQRRPRVIPTIINASIELRSLTNVFWAGDPIPIRVTTDTPSVPHELELHEYDLFGGFAGAHKWPGVPHDRDPIPGFDSTGVAELDVAGGVTDAFSMYTLFLWADGAIADQVDIVTFFSSSDTEAAYARPRQEIG